LGTAERGEREILERRFASTLRQIVGFRLGTNRHFRINGHKLYEHQTGLSANMMTYLTASARPSPAGLVSAPPRVINFIFVTGEMMTCRGFADRVAKEHRLARLDPARYQGPVFVPPSGVTAIKKRENSDIYVTP